MLRAHRSRTYLTSTQAQLLNQSFGLRCWVYNQAPAKKIEFHQTQDRTLNGVALMQLLPQLKTDFDWLEPVPSQSLQPELSHLDATFGKFFKKNGGFPKFKSLYRSRDILASQNIKRLGWAQIQGWTNLMILASSSAATKCVEPRSCRFSGGSVNIH